HVLESHGAQAVTPGLSANRKLSRNALGEDVPEADFGPGIPSGWYSQQSSHLRPPFRTGAWQDIGYGERESSAGAGAGRRSAVRHAEQATTHSMWGGCRVCPSREGCDGDLAMVGDAGVVARILWDLREGALGTLPGRGPGQPVVSGTRAKSNPANQRTRRVQRVARGVCAGSDFVFREGFPADGSQPDGICLGAVRRARDRWTDGWDFGLWRHWPSRGEPRAYHEHARACDEAACSRID